MYLDDDIRFRHRLDAAQKAVKLVQKRNRTDLDIDDLLAPALFHYIEVVGEAASRITRQRQSELPQIPWASMIGMRNRLVHAYFDIDLDVVWDTVTQNLPQLIAELEKIIVEE